MVAPAAQGFYSAMAEPLFGNDVIALPVGSAAACDAERTPLLAPQDLPTARASGWTSLAAIRAAAAGGEPPGAVASEATAHAMRLASWHIVWDLRSAMRDPSTTAVARGARADAEYIVSLLPARWRAFVEQAGPDPAPEWVCFDAPWVAQLTPGAPPCWFRVLADGRLQDVPAAQATSAPNPAHGTAAAVFPRPKPRHRWTPEDHEAAAAAAPGGSGGGTPVEYWLLGAWRDIRVDPSVWG